MHKRLRYYEECGIVAKVGEKSFVFTDEDIVAIVGSITLVCASQKKAYAGVYPYWGGQGVSVECVEELDLLLLLTYHDGRDKPLAFLDMEDSLPLKLVYLLLHQERLANLRLAIFLRQYYKTLRRNNAAVYDKIEAKTPWQHFELFVKKITNKNTHTKVTIPDDTLSIHSGNSAYSASAVPNLATNTSKTKTKKHILANKKRIANLLKIDVGTCNEIPFAQLSTMCLHMRQVCKMNMSSMIKCMWNWDIFNGIASYANVEVKVPGFFGIIPTQYSKMLFVPSIKDTDLYIQDAVYRKSLSSEQSTREAKSTWVEVHVDASDTIIAQAFVTITSRNGALYKLAGANVGVITYGEYIELLASIESPGEVKDYIGKYLGTGEEEKSLAPPQPSQEETNAATDNILMADLDSFLTTATFPHPEDFQQSDETYFTPSRRPEFELEDLCEPPSKRLKTIPIARKDMDRVAAVTAESVEDAELEAELEAVTSTRVVEFIPTPSPSTLLDQPTHYYELKKTVTLQLAYSILDKQAQNLFVPDNAVQLAETLLNKKFDDGDALLSYIYFNSFLRNKDSMAICENVKLIAKKYFADPLCKIFIARACGLDIGGKLIKRS